VKAESIEAQLGFHAKRGRGWWCNGASVQWSSLPPVTARAAFNQHKASSDGFRIVRTTCG
jgi:hypothetical protein